MALELEMLIRHVKRYLRNPGADYSADSLELGTFVEGLAFYLQEISVGKYSLERWFDDVDENKGKTMDEIGYDRCKEYLDQFKRLLNMGETI